MIIEGEGFVEELELQGVKVPDDIIDMSIDIPANGTIKISYHCHLDERILEHIMKAVNKHHDK